ncbi:arginine--tRNA ligase [Candidatus Bathyarchaeota archaeon]|nr:arginine--tRNA ligase [Candidatus Bathyarchaeota archaeon]
MRTPERNPFGRFRIESETILKNALTKVIPWLFLPSFELKAPPSPELGELTSPMLFELSKKLAKSPKTLADQVLEAAELEDASLVDALRVAGGGYLNFYANYGRLAELTLESAKELDQAYGSLTEEKPIRIIVEHTSINPAGPIHVGTARNSIIGDSLNRLLKTRGHEVSTHFYVDDVGRQIAVLAYGYKIIGQPKPNGKPDHWIGKVYAITNCAIEVKNLNAKIQDLQWSIKQSEEIDATRRKLDEWVSVAAELREKDKELFDKLTDAIRTDPDSDAEISKILRMYERQDKETVSLVRHVVNLCLGGFKETYGRIGIVWDSWDWESDIVWDGSVTAVIARLKETPYLAQKAGAIAIDAENVAKDFELKKLFGIPEALEIPPLVLMRSDGTTLYSTRDIAYSLKKLAKAERVINVIGMEQIVPQIQLKVALSLITSPKRAIDLVHYSYELVSLPGYKMSKRRGRFIAFDDILDEAVKKAKDEVEKRSPQLSEQLKQEISKAVGVGAVKYSLLDVAANKQVVFTWDRVLNFDINSAPFVQYAHARACNILGKLDGETDSADYTFLKEPVEHELVRMIASFPEIIMEAADNLVPNAVTGFAYDLAAKFNSFYANLPVLKAEPTALRDTRISLVNGVRVSLRNALNVLGIEALERM